MPTKRYLQTDSISYAIDPRSGSTFAEGVMGNPLIMYSVNSTLAYRINQKYYKGLHYVWTCPYFDSLSNDSAGHSAPPSSNPAQLYRNLQEIVAGGDKNNAQILNHKSGLRHGAIKKREAGIINDEQLCEISCIIDEVEVAEFSPLLYVIPFSKLVARIAHEVAASAKAHPFSEEYLIDGLPRKSFDLMKF